MMLTLTSLSLLVLFFSGCVAVLVTGCESVTSIPLGELWAQTVSILRGWVDDYIVPLIGPLIAIAIVVALILSLIYGGTCPKCYRNRALKRTGSSGRQKAVV